MDRLLHLSGREPIAAGRKRLVFAHPDDPSLLIKVMRPEFRSHGDGSESRISARIRRYYFSMSFIRELRELVALRFEDNAHPRFVHQVVGFAETDLGLGLVTVAAKTRDGGYAPTLLRLIDEGRIDSRVVADLERFCRDLSASKVVVGDMHPGNIVLAEDENGSRFMLVDGIGDKTYVPLLRLSRMLSRRSKARKIARLWQALESRPQRRAPAPGMVLVGSATLG